MKHLKGSIFLLIFLAACTAPQEENTIPEDLAAKKTLLKEKRAEISELNRFLKELEEAIAEQDPNAIEKPKRLVTTVAASKETFKHFVEIQGAVEADDLIDVTSEAAGIILNMPVKEGGYIRKGQLVAKLDMEQVNKQIAELEKSKELADIVYDRQKRLWDQNIGSELQFLEAKNKKESLEKSIETIKFQLTKAEIFSPVSGVVERVVLKSGELASPGAPIIQILNVNKLKVVADVPENLLTSVKRGDVVTINYPAINFEQRASISLLGRTIDEANRTFEIEVNIPNAKGLLKPNLLANVLVNDYTEENAVIVPLDAILEEVGGKEFVFIKKDAADGATAKKIYVTTGEGYRGDIIVTEGLTGNETLILEGNRGLADNEPIQVQNPKNESING